MGKHKADHTPKKQLGAITHQQQISPPGKKQGCNRHSPGYLTGTLFSDAQQ
jgi:hypothetical protein